MFKLLKNKKISTKSGFTMAELIMVMAIFSILTAVTVWNYGKFNNNIIMTNMAYEIALSVREAQVFSLGVRGSSTNFDTRYGVYFNSDPSANPQNFVFFADRNSNGTCEDGANMCSIDECISGSECEQLNSLTRGIEVSRVCVSDAGDIPMDFDTGDCSADGDLINEAAVTFERPNPDAFVYDIDNNQTFRNIAVLIESGSGAKRAIYIRENGQISVEFVIN